MAMVERLTIIRGVEKFELQTKTAHWVLAKEEGYSPVQMLVSAIGACGDTCINPFWKIRTFPLSLKNRSHVFKRSRETRTTIKTGDDSLLCVCSRRLSSTGDTVFEACLPKLSSDSIIS